MKIKYIALLVITLALTSAYAQELTTFSNASDTDLNNVANWDNTLPTDDLDGVVNNEALIAAGATAISSANFGSDAVGFQLGVAGALTLSSGHTLNLGNGTASPGNGSLTVQDGGVVNLAGTVLIYGGGADTSILEGGTLYVLSGGMLDTKKDLNMAGGTIHYAVGSVVSPTTDHLRLEGTETSTLSFDIASGVFTAQALANTADLTQAGGANLVADITGANAGDAYTILTAAGGITGTFADFSYTIDDETLTAAVTYDANSATINVTSTVPTPPNIRSFSASNTNVLAGTEITLSWDVFDATGLSIDQGIGDVTAISVDGAGSTQLVFNADITYTLTATNSNGSSVDSVTINAITAPPVINSFTASSTNVFSGWEVTLFWDVSAATELSIDQGIGDVLPISVDGAGSTQLVFNTDITYTLTAGNINGSVVDSVTINENTDTNPSGICLNFNSGGSGVVAGSEVVGLNGVPADYWVGLGSSATAVDIDGVAGSATIDYVAAWTFFGVSVDDGTQNSLMMQRGIRVGGTGDETLTISGLDSEYTDHGYDVYVYYGSDQHERTHRFLVDGVAISGTEQATSSWQGSFIQTSADADIGNYAVASNLTASSFTIVDNGTSPGKPGITGIEIIKHYVEPIPVFLFANVISGGAAMEISWIATNGASYTVETNSNLVIGNWQSFLSDIDGIDGEIAVTNAIGPDQTFYQVISE